MPKARYALTAVALGGLVLTGCSTSAGQDPATNGSGTSGHHGGDVTTSDQHNNAGATSGNATVMTKLLEFQPEKLTVKAGTTVVWKVSDSLGHTVTTGTFTAVGDGLRSAEEPDGVLDMTLTQGKTASHTFDKPGTYTYYCSIHKGMNGEITVTP